MTFIFRRLVTERTNKNRDRCKTNPADGKLSVSEYATVRAEGCQVNDYEVAKNVFTPEVTIKQLQENKGTCVAYQDKGKTSTMNSVGISNGYELAKNIKGMNETKSKKCLSNESVNSDSQEENNCNETDKQTHDKLPGSGIDTDNTYSSTLTEKRTPTPDATYSHLEIADDTYNTTSPFTRQDEISGSIDTYAHLDEGYNNYDSTAKSMPPDTDATYSHLKR